MSILISISHNIDICFFFWLKFKSNIIFVLKCYDFYIVAQHRFMVISCTYLLWFFLRFKKSFNRRHRQVVWKQTLLFASSSSIRKSLAHLGLIFKLKKLPPTIIFIFQIIPRKPSLCNLGRFWVLNTSTRSGRCTPRCYLVPHSLQHIYAADQPISPHFSVDK